MDKMEKIVTYFGIMIKDKYWDEWYINYYNPLTWLLILWLTIYYFITGKFFKND